MNELTTNSKNLLKSLVTLINSTRNRLASSINNELSLLYWNIGKQISENILENKRANYGKQIITGLSKELTQLYGRGFSKRNIHNFLNFYELYPDIQIVHSLGAQLSWTHIRNFI